MEPRCPALDGLRKAQFPTQLLADVLDAVAPSGGVLFAVSPEGGLSDSAEEHTSFECWPGEADSDTGFEPEDAKRTALGLAFASELLNEWAERFNAPRLVVIAQQYAELG